MLHLPINVCITCFYCVHEWLPWSALPGAQALSQIHEVPVQTHQAATAAALDCSRAPMEASRWNGQNCCTLPGKWTQTEVLIGTHSLGYFLLFSRIRTFRRPLRSVGDKAELEEPCCMNKPTWWKAWYPGMGFFFPNPICSNVKARKGNSHGNLWGSWRWWHSLIKSCKFLEIKRCWPQREG